MLLIGFTQENRVANEAQMIESALDSGLNYIHIRKPSWNENQLRELITSISSTHYDRLTLHDQLQLATELSLGGVHLNRRNPEPPRGFCGRVSRSCHSIEEVEINRELTYCTLSPIFDAISKNEYESNFTQKELKKGFKSAILGEKTIALGGICDKNITKIYKFGFGGAAILGYLWDEQTVEGVSFRVKKLREILEK